jgi:hypothetical protein
MGVRIPNVWTDLHRSNNSAYPGCGTRPNKPIARSRVDLATETSQRPRGPDSAPLTGNTLRSVGDILVARWAWQDSNLRHEG